MTKNFIWHHVMNLRDSYKENIGASPEDINSGYCEAFANELVKSLGGWTADCYAVSISQFLENGEDEAPLDRDLLQKYWPKVVPPEGMDWDELDLISKYYSFDNGLHVWTIYQGRHYDSEAPQGTDNFFDLPFFQRAFAWWTRHRSTIMNCERIKVTG